MQESQENLRHRLRSRGLVGVWSGLLGTASAAQEREAVAAIEDLGYGSLWISETGRGKEAFAHAGILLAATRRLIVGTGIANVWARDATATSLGGHALAEAYPGRFVLGLGISHGSVVSDRGHAYSRPLRVMREYLDRMDDVDYPPNRLVELPRVLAALRPGMLGLARGRAGGAHPYLVPPGHTYLAREYLGPEPLLIPEQAVLLERDPARARAAARTHVAYYLALPNYVNNLREHGFDEEDLAGGGSDRLVDALVAWGDVDAVRDRIEEHLAAGADHVLVQPLPGLSDDGLGLRQLTELAPALSGWLAGAAAPV